MFWVVIIASSLTSVVSANISDDYLGKDDVRFQVFPSFAVDDKKNAVAHHVGRTSTRRLFDWIQNLVGGHKGDESKNTTPSPSHISYIITKTINEKTVDEVLETMNHIADSIDKLNGNAGLLLHLMVKDANVDEPHFKRFTKAYYRREGKYSSEEQIIEPEVTTTENRVNKFEYELIDSVNRIVNALEIINLNLEMSLHMMLDSKNTIGRISRRKPTRRVFEWLVNAFSSGTTSTTDKTQENIINIKTRSIQNDTPEELVTAIRKISDVLDKINTNIELQVHMMIDCNCKDKGKRDKRMSRPNANTMVGIFESDNNENMLDNIIENRNKRQVENKSKQTAKISTRIIKTDDSRSNLDNFVSKRKKRQAGNVESTTQEPKNNTKLDNDLETLSKLSNNLYDKINETVTEENKTLNVSAVKDARRQEGVDVKAKLLNYIYEANNEIENKLYPVSQIKQQFMNDDVYKIGYTIANIDALQVNIMNLKKDVDNYKEHWDETKTMNILDTFMSSNRLVTSLIENLTTRQSKLLADSLANSGHGHFNESGGSVPPDLVTISK